MRENPAKPRHPVCASDLVELMSKGVADLIWLAGIVAWYGIRYPFERKARKTRVRRSLLDWREWILVASFTLGAFVIPGIFVAIGFPSTLDRPFDPAAAWLGAAVLGAALWLFRRSHADLGRNWSVTLKLRTEHAVVRTGVYRLVRHPMYSSFLLLGLAQALLLANWFVDAAGLAGAAVLVVCRMAREEAMMLDSFGRDYRAYMERTKRIIPWLI